MVRHTCRILTVLTTLLGAATPALDAQEPATVTGTVVIGTVTTPDSLPLAGVSVTIPALNQGTVTRADGRYALTVPAARATAQPVEVLFRLIGYRPTSARATLGADPTTIDVTLEPNPLQLGEIVATGAGTETEVGKLASVRNNIDSALIQRASEPNFVNALAAKAPNVQVVSNAGDPGASTSIQIRGANTLNGASDPLFVVDGVPIDNSTTPTSQFDGAGFDGQGGTSAPNRAIDLNPNDIESVEILKGAAAGAVYGARAGQGVILVTTKRGRAGPTSYSLRSSVSLNDVTRFQPLQRRFAQGDGGLPDACAQSSASGGPVADCYATSDSWGPELCAQDVCPGTFDHSREYFRTGFQTDNVLAISGGTDRTTFFLSGGLLNQTGTIVGPNNSLNRITLRLRGDQRLTDRLKVGGNVGYTSTKANYLPRGNTFSGVLVTGWSSAPTFDNDPYQSTQTGLHRSYTFPNPSFASDTITRGYDNPFFSAYEDISTSITNRVVGSADASWRPADWLRFEYTLGLDHYNDDRVQAQAQTSSNTLSPRGQVVKVGLGNTQLDHNLVGTVTWQRSQRLGGSVAVGWNLNTRSLRQLGVTGNGLIAPTPFSIGNTSSQLPATDVETKVRTEGYFAQATLDLAQQLFLKAGVRYDGVSTFGAARRRNWFPSVSTAWEFTRALGTSDAGLLSYGKLRAAFGEVGTQPSPYLSSVVFAGGRIGDGGAVNVPPGGLFTPVTRPATDLAPERTREFEMGTDLGLFGGAADLSFTWYYRDSRDVILAVPTALSTGYAQQYRNGARVRNAGTEWSLNLRPITRRSFAWDLGFVLGTNRNRVLALEGAQYVSYGGAGGFGLAVAQVGQPIGAFLDYDYVRCGRGLALQASDGSVYDVDANCTAQQRSGHALFVTDGTLASGGDLGAGSGYPLLDPTRRVVGSPEPDWTGSIRTGVRIGRLLLSGLVDIRHGGLLYNGTRGALNTIGTSAESGRRGQSVTIGTDFLPGPVAGPGAGQQVVLTEDFIRNYYNAYVAIGTPWYETASFAKLREVSIGWSLSKDPLSRVLGLSGIDLRIAGRNLVTWTSYTGIDPEVNLAGAETGARNIDWFSNPQTRSFVFSVTLNR